MTEPKILVAGIGNIFLGDDAFGVEVAQRLLARPQMEGVRVADFGIRGFDLAYAMMDDYSVTILVDAVPRGDVPGTLYVIEPELDKIGNGAVSLETHGMDPVKVLNMVKALGGEPKRVLVVGCEPFTFGPDDGGQMGLSEPVAEAIDRAVTLVETLVERIRSGSHEKQEV